MNKTDFSVKGRNPTLRGISSLPTCGVSTFPLNLILVWFNSYKVHTENIPKQNMCDDVTFEDTLRDMKK